MCESMEEENVDPFTGKWLTDRKKTWETQRGLRKRVRDEAMGLTAFPTRGRKAGNTAAVLPHKHPTAHLLQIQLKGKWWHLLVKSWKLTELDVVALSCGFRIEVCSATY